MTNLHETTPEKKVPPPSGLPTVANFFYHFQGLAGGKNKFDFCNKLGGGERLIMSKLIRLFVRLVQRAVVVNAREAALQHCKGVETHAAFCATIVF
jgi:hypothetical protein